MKRVMIVGQPGAGKSTLARALGQRTGLPVVHIDCIHWQPGWVERDRASKIALMRAEEERDAWIIEGGLSATWDTRLARADTVIVLEFPTWLRLWRVVKRRIEYAGGQTRPDLPPDCPERFDAAFLRWIWDTRHSNRLRNRALIARAAPRRTCLLTGPRAVRRFLRDLDSGGFAGQ